MKNQALFSSKDKSKKLKCHLLKYLFGALRVNPRPELENISVTTTDFCLRLVVYFTTISILNQSAKGTKMTYCFRND